MKKLFARIFLKNILIFTPIFFLGGCLELFTTDGHRVLTEFGKELIEL